MRLLQLNPNGSEASALDLHPMVSVVTGLGPAGRDTVLKAGRALPGADDPGCPGLVEAHGVMLDLDQESLRLLGMDRDLEVVVGRDDLPTGSAGAAAPVAEGPRPSIDAFLEQTPAGFDEALDGARRAQSNAREALAVLDEAARAARAKYDDVALRKRRAEAALAAAAEPSAPHLRLVTDAETGAKVTSDDTDLEELRRHRADLTDQIAELDERIRSIERSLDELSAIDTRPLVVLLEAIKNPQPIEYVPSERARELADEFVSLQATVNGIEAEMEASGRGPASAMARLEECRAEVAAAEKAMRKPELSPEDIAELEAAHEAVLEAEKKASGGLRKKGGHKAMEEAQRREQEVLDRVGFPTWSAYVMGAGLLAIDHVAEQRLERARFDLEAAEATWNQVSAALEANPEHKEVLDRLEELYIEAQDLLGGQEPDDLERALREYQVPKREVTTEELADALAYQLELVGLSLGPSPAVDLTVMAAEAFVEEAAAIGGRVAELTDERHQAVAERDVAAARLDELPEVPEPPTATGESAGAPEDDAFAPFAVFDTGDSGDASEPDGEPDEADEADERTDEPEDSPFAAFPSLVDGVGSTAGGSASLALVPDEETPAGDGADEDLTELERERDEAVEDEAEYREWMESREALLDAAIQVETVATSRLMRVAADLIERDYGAAEGGPGDGSGPDLDAVRRYLLDRAESLRSVSFAGSVPLVVDDALAGRPAAEVEQLLTDLEPVASGVQIIYLSDDPTVVGWAERAGFERAAVVPAPPALAQ